MRNAANIEGRGNHVQLAPMDYVRAAIANAQAEAMTLTDLQHAAQHAATCERFGAAVNELAQTGTQYASAKG